MWLWLVMVGQISSPSAAPSREKGMGPGGCEWSDRERETRVPGPGDDPIGCGIDAPYAVAPSSTALDALILAMLMSPESPTFRPVMNEFCGRFSGEFAYVPRLR